MIYCDANKLRILFHHSDDTVLVKAVVQVGNDDREPNVYLVSISGAQAKKDGKIVVTPPSLD